MPKSLPKIKNYSSGQAIVMVFVGIDHHDPDVYLTSTGDLILPDTQITTDETVINDKLDIGTIKIDNLNNSVDVIGPLKSNPWH